jgi:hypothetical protein
VVYGFQIAFGESSGKVAEVVTDVAVILLPDRARCWLAPVLKVMMDC